MQKSIDGMNGCVFAANSPFGKQMVSTLFEKGCNIAMIDDKQSMESLEQYSKQLNAGHNREGYSLPDLEHFVFPIELHPEDHFHTWEQALFQARTCFLDGHKLHFLIIWDCKDEKQKKKEEWMQFLEMAVPYLVTSNSPRSKCNDKQFPMNMLEAFVVHITNDNADSSIPKFLSQFRDEGVGYCNMIVPENIKEWSGICRMIASILYHDTKLFPSLVDYRKDRVSQS